MTPAATVAGARQVLTRDQAIQALRDYAELYGDAFTTAAFNPSVAKWRDDPTSRERYLAGNPKTGEPWPSLNSIKGLFGGSFNAAREAAGLAPNTPGPGRGKRPAHKHAPIRGVDDRVRVVVRERAGQPEVSASGNSGELRELRELRRELAAMERDRDRVVGQLAKANGRLSDARARARTAQTGTTKQRERADRNAASVKALRDELRETARLLAAARDRLAIVTRERDELRTESVELKLDLEATREELERAREQAELADPEELRRAADEVRAARGRVAEAREAQAAAERQAAVARAAQRAAEKDRDRAQAEASEQVRRRVEVQRAVVGHDRPLSSSEVEELRGRGPAGAAVFTAAVKAVARAQAREPGLLGQRLREAAAAAIRWSERL